MAQALKVAGEILAAIKDLTIAIHDLTHELRQHRG
jgi:hypothetical protein